MLTWLRKNMKMIMIVVAVLFAASMFYGLGYRGMGGEGGEKSNVIAKVNGREVSPLRFRDTMNRLIQNFGANVTSQNLPFIENMALGQTIDFTLMLNEAKKRVRVSGKEVDAAIDGIMRQQKIPSQRELSAALQRGGLDMGKFRDMIKDEIMVQKLYSKLQETVKVTPDDLLEIRASHILVTRESEAKELLEKIKKGGDFSALARQYSKDPGSATKGGDLGYFTRGTMVEPFDKAVFSLKPGEVSGIVKTPYGFHIIKLTDSRMRKFPGKEQDIEKLVLKEKQEGAFRKWYSEVRGKAKIEIVSPELKGHELRFKGNIPEAIKEYQKAIAQDPGNPYLHIFLADTYISTGQKDLALSEYENAIRIEGANPDMYIILGKAYESAGQKDLAAEQYRKASLIAGDNKALHEKLLQVFQEMKRGGDVAREKAELQRIARKESFEKELKGGK